MTDKNILTSTFIRPTALEFYEAVITN